VKIVVLEDMEARVDWLRGKFPNAAIDWHTTVSDFVDCLRSGIKPDLVIFDHDLDTADPNAKPGQLHDKDGLTGADAARMMPNPEHAMLWVWSANPIGARVIADIISQKAGIGCALMSVSFASPRRDYAAEVVKKFMSAK
jgi:hypothetical protein